MSGFRTKYSTPTDEQAALVGHVVMDCAILEFNLAALAARLALIPDLPGRVVFDRMSVSQIDDRITRLLQLHEQRYEDRVIGFENRLAIEAALRSAREVRLRRNKLSHGIGFRLDDDMIDIFALTKAVLVGDKHHTRETVASLRLLRSDIRGANEALEAAVSLVPERPELLEA